MGLKRYDYSLGCSFVFIHIVDFPPSGAAAWHIHRMLQLWLCTCTYHRAMQSLILPVQGRRYQ